MKYLLLGLIHLYRLCIAPLLGNVCRFYPTCSQYALEALRRHGAWKGSWLICKRLSKCHPWHPGGIDELDH